MATKSPSIKALLFALILLKRHSSSVYHWQTPPRPALNLRFEALCLLTTLKNRSSKSGKNATWTYWLIKLYAWRGKAHADKLTQQHEAAYCLTTNSNIHYLYREKKLQKNHWRKILDDNYILLMLFLHLVNVYYKECNSIFKPCT